MKRFDCLIIGDVMLDVFVRKSRTALFPTGGTSYLNYAKIDLGGAGNVAEGMSLLGAKTCFIGKAGNDCWGKIYEENLHGKGVNARILFEENASTGVAQVVSGEKGERTFHVFRGANDKLVSKEIDQSIGLIKNSEYLYFSGYSLVSNPQRDAILHAFELARKDHIKVVFDPGVHNLVKSNFDLFKGISDKCDVFCPNFEEAKAITKTTTLKEALVELQERKSMTALKCGARGCFLIGPKNTTRIRAFKTECQDTTGAGDAFAAGLIFGLVKHFPLESIGRLANWFAARAVTNIGARNFPSKTEIRSFLKELKTAEK
jgi:sugar/nucleoside kinase (ribokinase family)